MFIVSGSPPTGSPLFLRTRGAARFDVALLTRGPSFACAQSRALRPPLDVLLARGAARFDSEHSHETRELVGLRSPRGHSQ